MPTLTTPKKAVTASIIAVVLEYPAHPRNGTRARTVKENPMARAIARAGDDFRQHFPVLSSFR
jgi:hypothetical protein